MLKYIMIHTSKHNRDRIWSRNSEIPPASWVLIVHRWIHWTHYQTIHIEHFSTATSTYICIQHRYVSKIHNSRTTKCSYCTHSTLIRRCVTQIKKPYQYVRCFIRYRQWRTRWKYRIRSRSILFMQCGYLWRWDGWPIINLQ